MKTHAISIIGAGRLATHLATAWAERGLTIRQVYSRRYACAQHLADRVAAQAVASLTDLQQVDLLLIAVNDDQIANVAAQLAENGYQGLVAHTSGSTALSRLSQYGLVAGVIYPLQSFSAEQAVDWQHIAIFIEATAAADLAQLQQLSGLLSKQIYHYSSEQRLGLHVAAVFACNFSNYCVDIAEQVLQKQQIDRHLLLPLIQHTMAKLASQSARANQTGPAMRQDQNIIQQHLQLLQPDPQWAALYQLMSHAIQQRHAPVLHPATGTHRHEGED
jgi:predicted short-subunit dehydrogenase-like oxidoreductase (DUF2520 family)